MARPKDVRPDAAVMLGGAIMMFLYGLYAALFTACMFSLRLRHFKNKLVHASITLLFVMVTIWLIIEQADIYNIFVAGRVDPGIGYLLSHPANKLKSAAYILYYLITLVTEALLLWRLFVVWNDRKLVLILPCIIFAAYFISGAGLVIAENVDARVGKGRSRVAFTFSRLTSGTLVAQNFIVTLLIVGKLWYMVRSVRGLRSSGDSPYKNVISAIIESGAIFTVMYMILAMLVPLGYNIAAWMVLYWAPIVAGIVPTLIVTQLNFGAAIASQSHSTTQGSTPSTFVVRTHGRSSRTNANASTDRSLGRATDAWRRDRDLDDDSSGKIGESEVKYPGEDLELGAVKTVHV